MEQSAGRVVGTIFLQTTLSWTVVVAIELVTFSLFALYLLVAFGLAHTWPPFGWLWDGERELARKVAAGRALQGKAAPESPG